MACGARAAANLGLMSLVDIVSLQLLLYAPLWLLAASVFKDERPAVWHWFGYALGGALAMGLMTTRVHGPSWANTAGVALCVLGSLMLARRGIERFLRLPPRDLELLGLAVVAIVGLGFAGPTPAAAPQRAMLTSGLCAVLIAGALPRCWGALKAEYSRRLAVAAALPVLAVLAIHLLQLPLAWNQPEVLRDQALDAARIPARTWIVVLVSAAAFNYLFLFLAVLRLVNRLNHQARHDPLTGLLNRRAMGHVLDSEWERWRAQGAPFTVITLDLDHFKRINDEHGHGAGDEVLRQVARLLREHLRPVDRCARIGGEELQILLPGYEDGGRGRELAEHLCALLARTPVAIEGRIPLAVTASWGVAGPHGGDADMAPVLARADRALYAAKHGGRNRVVLATPEAQGGSEQQPL